MAIVKSDERATSYLINLFEAGITCPSYRQICFAHHLTIEQTELIHRFH